MAKSSKKNPPKVFISYAWKNQAIAKSLMEPKKHGELYIDPIFDRKQSLIWTADKSSAGAAWVVNFYGGYCYNDSLDFNHCVRVVR